MDSNENSCYTTDTSEDEHTFRHAKKCFEKDKLRNIRPRPNASGGYWLCCLLPLAFTAVQVKYPGCELPYIYKELMVAATGMAVQSLCFFVYAFFQLALPIDVLISCIPAIFTITLYRHLLLETWWWSIFWGFTTTYAYQKIYIHAMQRLPKTFSFGECSIFAQGLLLFLITAARHMDLILSCNLVKYDYSIFSQLAGIMLFAFSCLYVLTLLIYRFEWLQSAIGFYPLFAAVVSIIFCTPITDPLPILLVMNFILHDENRRLTVIFYATLVAFTALTVYWQLQHATKANTRIRKIFHLLIVLVYVPGILFDCAFIYLASGVALAIFLVLEIIRICKIAPLGETLKQSFVVFSDEKDVGCLALTPISLLVGCSIPMWIHPCICQQSNNMSLVAQLSGILVVGFGDTAASVMGSKFGKRKWLNSARSKEGTLAFIVAVLMAIISLNGLGFIIISHFQWMIVVFATVATALVEAKTDQIDNLVLPLIFYIFICLS